MNIEFLFDRVNRFQSPVRLLYASHYTADDHCRSGRQTMDSWTLDAPLTEAGATRVGKGPWLSRGPGWAHLYRPGSYIHHDTSGIKSVSHESAYICFEGGEELGFGAMTDNEDGFARIYDPRFLIFGRICAIAEVMTRGGMQREFGALAELYGIADLLCAGCERMPEGFFQLRPELLAGDSPELADRVYRLLNADYARAWTLAGLAAVLHVSVSTLAHEYRRSTGGSVMAALQAIRMRHGQRLLREGESVKETARRVGFGDENYFSKIFRRRFGVPPGAFRRQAGAPDES